MKAGLIVMKFLLTVGANQVNASRLHHQALGEKD